MTLRDTAYFWVGTNANLFFVAVGVIALELGLSVWQALVAVVLGTLMFATVAVASIAGVRSGLPTMTFTRAVFGPRGNLPHVVLAWAASVAFEAINCIFGVYALLALMPLLGWEHPGDEGKVLATLVVLGGSGAIAIYGHATMVHLQRVFAVALTVVLALVLVYCIGGVDWSASGTSELTRWETLAVILAAGAVIASGPISYLFNGPDWVRYLPSRTAGRSVFWTVFLGQRRDRPLPLGMGVLLASRGDMSDPVGGVEPFVPRWLFVLYILAAVGGSIANNVVAYYSSGLCLQSAGLPLERYRRPRWTPSSRRRWSSTSCSCRTSRRCCITSSRCSSSGSGPFAAVWMTDGMMRRWRYSPARHPRRRGDERVLGLARRQPARLDRAAGRRRRVPADDQRADPARPGQRGARRRRPHLDPRTAGQRGRLLGAGARHLGGQSRRSSLARATATARVSASSLR